jgi:hypothetical protein
VIAILCDAPTDAPGDVDPSLHAHHPKLIAQQIRYSSLRVKVSAARMRDHNRRPFSPSEQGSRHPRSDDDIDTGIT